MTTQWPKASSNCSSVSACTGKDLDKKLIRYIRAHNKNPKPIKWKYDDPNRRHRQFF